MIALDDFRGAGGWSVACRALGIHERGVEIMAEANATATANGFETYGRDVWTSLMRGVAPYHLLISSPPCQPFSTAGNGAGRAVLDELLGLIDSKAYFDIEKLRAFGEQHDPRTALVLTPLARVAEDAPLYVVLEQVPTVLPVWERFAVELRRFGYSVVTGILNAEQYGVPQTRRRAVLIARADGVEARMPTPTHSRYYSRDPLRLDPGVLPWISMAKALGWVGSALVRSSFGKPKTVNADGTAAGGHHTFKSDEAPAHTVTGLTSGWLVSNSKAGSMAHWEVDGRPLNLDPSKPATTVQGDPRLTAREHHFHGEQNSTSTQVTIEEALALQSFPEGFKVSGGIGKQFLQVGNAVPPLLAQAILETLVDFPTT